MTTAILSTLAGVVYLLIASVIGTLIHADRVNKCWKCRNDICIIAHKTAAGFVASMWPISVFVLAGILFGGWISNRNQRLVDKANAEVERKRKELREYEEALKLLRESGVNV